MSVRRAMTRIAFLADLVLAISLFDPVISTKTCPPPRGESASGYSAALGRRKEDDACVYNPRPLRRQ
jgi:hypothetical protein